MFIVFDLECTGFSPTSDDIIQFAYIAFDGLNVVRSEVLYFYYEGMSWSEEAENVHHISQEFLKQYADDFQKNLIRMYTVLSGSNCCGFNNIHFDCPFAQTWLHRQGLPGLEYRTIQDVMVAFRPITHKPRISLINLMKLLKISETQIQSLALVWFKENAGTASHDAAYDTTATAICTLQGIKAGLIDFNDRSEKTSSDSEAKMTQSQLLRTEGNAKMRDPKGMLVYLVNGEENTPYLLNSDKQKYTSLAPYPNEVNQFTLSGKLVHEPFTKVDDVWQLHTSGSQKYVLSIGDDRDVLSLVLSSGKQVQIFPK